MAYISANPQTNILMPPLIYIYVGRQSVEYWENRKAEVAKGVVKSVCSNYQSYLTTQA